MNRKRATLAESIGYALLSIGPCLVGWLWADRLFEAGPLLYIGVQWIFGPIAFAWNVGSGIVEGSPRDVWVIFYVAETALLALCLLLIHPRSPSIRRMGVLLAVVTWLASGFPNFLPMFRGI